MIYVSIDIETTGLDWFQCQVLEFGAVIEDTNKRLPLDQLPTFRAFIKHSSLHWEEYAFKMHPDLMEQYDTPAAGVICCQPNELATYFKYFLVANGFQEEKGKMRVVPAGKNFAGFDRQFLDQLPGWKELISISRRALDPAPMFVDFANDQELPTLMECKRRAGLETHQVKHEALADALDVVELLRKFY